HERVEVIIDCVRWTNHQPSYRSNFIRKNLRPIGLPISQNCDMNVVNSYFEKIKRQIIEKISATKYNGGKILISFDEWTSFKNKKYFNVHLYSIKHDFNLELIPIWKLLNIEKQKFAKHQDYDNFMQRVEDFVQDEIEGKLDVSEFKKYKDYLHCKNIRYNEKKMKQGKGNISEDGAVKRYMLNWKKGLMNCKDLKVNELDRAGGYKSEFALERQVEYALYTLFGDEIGLSNLSKSSGKKMTKKNNGDSNSLKTPAPKIELQESNNSEEKDKIAYVCIGNFFQDFPNLYQKGDNLYIPQIKQRVNISNNNTSNTEESKSKATLKSERKKQQSMNYQSTETALISNSVLEDVDQVLQEPEPKSFNIINTVSYMMPKIYVQTEADKNDNVTEIYIKNWLVDEFTMKCLCQCIVSLDHLKLINFYHVGLTDETFTIFVKAISNCSNLKHLSIEANPIETEPWHLLLNDETSISFLNLRFNNITGHSMKKFVQNLQSNQKLLQLILHSNSLGDEGATYLAQALRTNRTLIVLGIASNNISDIGLKYLTLSLSEFKMTHEEIVERRRCMVAIKDENISTSISVDINEKAPSEKSTYNPPTKSKLKKKDTSKKDKEDEGKKVKADKSKQNKNEKTKRSEKGKTPLQKKILTHDSELSFVVQEQTNALLDQVKSEKNGQLILIGNRTLMSLNISDNAISENGLDYLLNMIMFQMSYIKTINVPEETHGLMNLCLQRNEFSSKCTKISKIEALLVNKSPIKSSSDQGSNM
ncbi:Leucine-rich repeat-containing protein 71, partial [Intoshia linei]